MNDRVRQLDRRAMEVDSTDATTGTFTVTAPRPAHDSLQRSHMNDRVRQLDRRAMDVDSTDATFSQSLLVTHF